MKDTKRLIISYRDKNQTALYEAADRKLYELVSFDNDCAIMCNASDNTFAVAVKPYPDDIRNMIDYSEIKYFKSLEAAMSFDESIHKCFSEIPENIKTSKLQEEKRKNLPRENKSSKHL